jgi:hypothetical protein
MPNWTPKDLERQMERARDAELVKQFKKYGADYQFPTALLMAIA